MTISCQNKTVCLVPCAYLGWGHDGINRTDSLSYFIMLLGGVAIKTYIALCRNMVRLVTV